MPKILLQTTMFENSPIRHRGTLHKTCLSSDDEDIIPIPIQIFLWRQSKSDI